MKKNILIVFLLFISSFISLHAQTTRVTYKKDYYDAEASAKIFKENKENLPQYVMDMIAESFRKELSNEFELIFDKSKSIYKKIEVLSTSDNNMSGSSSSDNVYFKNIETKDKIFKSQQTGTTTNVQVDFEQYKWEITTETKLINGYKCYKAKTKTSFFHRVKQEEVILNRIAWFTSEIPSSFGPEGFDGLPGLVLETAENEGICLHAIKIEFDCKKEIEKPKCNKTISHKEFKEILDGNYQKRLDEIQD
jgi:GLPGLI family protein